MRTRSSASRSVTGGGGRTAFVVALALAACSDPVGPAPDPILQLPRALTAAEIEVIERSNGFGFQLAREVASRDGRPNVVLSPLSASLALGMTLNGAAEGATFDAMRSTLGFEGLAQDEVNAAYRGLIDLLGSLDASVDLSLANAIWANETVAFHQEFFDRVTAAFDAEVRSADFAAPSTLADINGWVDVQTHGRIDKILDDLDPDLVMLLLNAIWFDGRWTTEFDPEKTRRARFERPDGTSVDVDLMNLAGVEVALGSGATWTAAELPYGGGAWSMLVVLPSGGQSARELLGTLDSSEWDAIVGSLHPVEIDQLSLPKFTLSYDAFLNDALQAMGMGIAFGPGADFSRLSPIGANLCIDFVRQKTFIEVDEAGTRAAAVTAVGIGPTSFNGMIVDRPFLFALRERLSGTILFMGLVEDPTFEGEPAEPTAGQCHG